MRVAGASIGQLNSNDDRRIGGRPGVINVAYPRELAIVHVHVVSHGHHHGMVAMESADADFTDMHGEELQIFRYCVY